VAPDVHARPSRLEEREVKVEDPALSPEARRRLTEELRAVVGSNRVLVPADRPTTVPEGHRTQARPRLLAVLTPHRLLLALTFLAFLTIGAILTLITRRWWLLPLAAGIHALGTMTVAALAIRYTTATEHPSPSTVALLEEEGIPDPEEYFSQLVAGLTGEPRRRGVAEVITPGANERTVDASEDPVRAAVEQQSSITPTGGPSPSGGEGGIPAFMNWTSVVALMALSIIVPAAVRGHWLWLLPAVFVPLATGWMALQRTMSQAGPEQDARVTARWLPAAIVIATAIAVSGFCALVALWLAR
jgi:hypothetical protein